MALYDRDDLIEALKTRLGRPTSDLAFTRVTTDDVYDRCLTEAQDHIQKQLAIHCPDGVWPAPTLLTSSDSGLTYGFGTDTDGEAIFAFGHFEVYADVNQIPTNPLIEGLDYEVVGTKIRMLNNSPRLFSAGPYARFASPSNIIDSTHEPVVPKIARLALLSEAEVGCWRVLGMDSTGAEVTAKRDWDTCLEAIKTQSMHKTNTPPRSRLATLARRYWR